MSIEKTHHASVSEDNWLHGADSNHVSDFVLIEERGPPPRIELARERMLVCRLYLGLLQTHN